MSLQARIAALITGIGTDIKTLLGRALPAGGAAGQVLAKTGAGDYAVGWADPAGGSGGAPGGDDGAVQYKSGTGVGGAANVDIHGGDLLLTANPTPSTPASGAKLVHQRLAGIAELAILGPDAFMTYLQRAISRKKIAWWNPSGGTTTVPVVWGMRALTSLGTATARAVALTNRLTRKKRFGYVSPATAGALAGHYAPWVEYAFGVDNGLGGFHLVYEFAFTDAVTVAGARALVGLRSLTSAPTNTDPSVTMGSVGIAQFDGSTQLYIVATGPSGSHFQEALPADFVAMGAGNAPIPYRLTLTSLPNEYFILRWHVENLSSGAIASGQCQVDFGATTMWGPAAYRSNNTTAAAVAIDIVNLYIESD